MQPKMGSPFSLVFYSDDSVKAATLAARSFHLVDSLNFIFSDYIPSSELNQLSASAGKDSFVLVSPLLYDMIVTSKQAWGKSAGAFDITIGPLSRL
jgi:FAD:protein FMN transferase